MKLLVVCQHYYPEPFRVNDFCEELARRGHEVMVVTGEPNYPEGVIYQGYEKHQRSDEEINGVKVHRCRIIPRKTGAVYRLLNYFSYAYSAKRFIRSCAASDGKPFDVVLVNQLSPVMMAEPAIAYKKKYGVPIVMYCLDLWPASLAAGGVRGGSVIYQIFHRISKRIYRAMDRILVASRMFRGYLEREFGIEDNVIGFLPQYAEGLFEGLPRRDPDGASSLVFAGNIGAAQCVDVILGAAEKLRDRAVHFHIVGGGTDLERLKGLAEGKRLDNVTFYGRRPLEEMPAFYAKADAMLVTLRADPILSLTLPGKVQSYMAAGKPIIGAVNGETAEVIKEAECGYCGPAESVDALVVNIRRFLEDEKKERLGANARAFYEKYFPRRKFMDKLEDELRKL